MKRAHYYQISIFLFFANGSWISTLVSVSTFHRYQKPDMVSSQFLQSKNFDNIRWCLSRNDKHTKKLGFQCQTRHWQLTLLLWQGVKQSQLLVLVLRLRLEFDKKKWGKMRRQSGNAVFIQLCRSCADSDPIRIIFLFLSRCDHSEMQILRIYKTLIWFSPVLRDLKYNYVR